MRSANSAVLLLAAILAGCTTASAPSGASGGTASATPAPSDPSLPAELKNDAYDYYGLGNTKPIRIELDNGVDAPQVGTRTVERGKIESDKASFVLHQEGALTKEGEITLSLEKDGLYAMSSSATKIKPHSLELPAKLDVGASWDDHTEMNDGQMDLRNQLKVVGRERVSTPGGTFDDALHVVSTGQGKMQGGQVEMTSDNWYVRGLGAVKQVLHIVPKDKKNKASKLTLQLAPAESDASSTAPAAPPVDQGAKK